MSKLLEALRETELSIADPDKEYFLNEVQPGHWRASRYPYADDAQIRIHQREAHTYCETCEADVERRRRNGTGTVVALEIKLPRAFYDYLELVRNAEGAENVETLIVQRLMALEMSLWAATEEIKQP